MRRRLVLAALAAAAVLALPASAPAASKWVVKGAGYGHGVGIGAWGAYGYGKHGASAKKIIKHYFRRVRITKLDRTPSVRVLLGVESGDVKFRRATRACGERLKASRGYRAHRAGSRVQLRSAAGKRIASCGKRLTARGKGKVRIGGEGTYRGALVAVPDGGGLNVINKVNVDDYVRGVLPVELYPDWPMATLKAFAFAMRSIALATDVGGKGFDIYSDTRTQVYGGVKVESKRTNRAAATTRGRVVTHRGRIAQTVYSSSSGGRTESRFPGGGKVPYFKSVKDPYDRYSPLHRWTLRFSSAEMNSRLGPWVKGRLRRVKVTERGDSPRIIRARLIGSRGRSTVTGETLRSALGLYSTWARFKKR